MNSFRTCGIFLNVLICDTELQGDMQAGAPTIEGHALWCGINHDW